MSSAALPFAPRDTLSEAARRRRARRRGHEDREYLAHVGSLPCLICGHPNIEVHHQPYKSDRANWHDHKTAPLCFVHHRGRLGPHTLSLEGFNAKHRVDLEAEVARIRREYLEAKG